MKIKEKCQTLVLLFAILLPFAQYLCTGLVAVAETLNTKSVELFENENGNATLDYSVNLEEDTIDWNYSYQKNASDEDTQFGLELMSDGQPLGLKEIVSLSGASFASSNDQLLQQTATKVNETGTVSFKTALVEEIKIYPMIMQHGETGAEDLLKDGSPATVHVDIPQTESSENNSSEEILSEDQQPVDNATVESETPSGVQETLPEESTEASKEVSQEAPKVAKRASKAVEPQNQGRDITSLSGSESMKQDSEGNKTIFDSAKITKDGQEIDGQDIKVNDNLLLQYTWSLPEELRKNIKAEDYFDFNLPEKFTIKGDGPLTGNLSDTNGVTFGQFTIQKDGSVRITFTEAVEKNSGIKGTLNVAGNVSLKDGEGGGDTTIVIPFVDGDVHVVPDIVVPNSKNLSKEVLSQTVNKDIQGNKGEVTWQIIANNTAKTMTDGQLTDTLPAGVTYSGDLKVMSYKVDLVSGNRIEPGTDVTNQVTGKPANGASGEFTLGLPTSDKAYVISFKTTVDFDKLNTDTSGNQAPTATNLTAKVVNQAKLTSKETGDVKANATATFNSASTLKKTAGKYDATNEVIPWTITFTKSGMDIPADTKFIDVMTNGQKPADAAGNVLTLAQLQKMISDAFNKGGSNSGKTVLATESANGYTLTFPEGISDSFNFTMYTSTKGGSAASYNNSIKWNGTGDNPNVPIPHDNSGVIKSSDKGTGTISPEKNDGKVTWTITVNSEHAMLDSWYISDTLTNSTWDGKSSSITVKEVKKGQEDNAATIVDSKDYTVSDITDKKFKLDYNNKSDSKFIITYQSNYDKNSLSTTVKNNVTYRYTQGGRSWSSSKDSSFQTPGDQRKKIAGNKGGEFNAVTNQVIWTIGLNTSTAVPYGDNAVLTDPIPTGQVYDSSVTPLVKDTAGNAVAGFTFKLVEKGETETFNGVTVNGGANGVLVVTGFKKGAADQYKVTFTTKVVTDKDTIAAGSATNKAYYQDDTNQPLEVTATVQYTNNNSYVNKTHQYDKSKDGDTIHYSIEVNPTSLTLKNVQLIDGSWQNLKVIPSTVKIVNNATKADVTDDFKLETAEQQFKILFNDINQHYTVTYDATIIYTGNPGATVPVSNKVTITGDNIKIDTNDTDKTTEIVVPDAGGTAEGEVRKLVVQKTDQDTGEAVEGATLALYRGPVANGQLVAEQITNSEGQAAFGNLTYDTYTLIEINPADGYYISNELAQGITYQITNDTDKETGKVITVENQKVGRIKLTKVDANDSNKLLDGAVFKLYEKDGTTQVTKDALGNSIDQFVTTNGTIEIDNLKPGEYVLKEISAPSGYQLSTGTVPANVEPDKTSEVTAKNKIYEGVIEFVKTDGNKKLSGAEFTLSYDGNPEHDVVKNSDKNGLVSFDLEANKVYTVKETKNPLGYLGSFELTKIQVTDAGKIIYGDEGKEYIVGQPLEVQNELETIDINGEKTWNIADNDASFVLPQSIKVELYQKGAAGSKALHKTVQVTADDQWQYRFTKLPKYDTSVTPPVAYEYSIAEQATGFTTEVSGTNLINTLKTTEIKGTKTWDSLAENYNLIPDSIVVHLEYSLDKGNTWQAYMRNNQAVTQQVTKDNSWSYAFSNLPQNYQGSAEVQYRVKEEAITGFSPEATGNNIKNNLDTTEIAVEKNWSDQDNYYSTRPTDLSFTLMVKTGADWQPFEEVYGVEKTITLDGQGNKWTGSFTKLPKYDQAGQLIQFAVRENLAGSANTYTPSGGQIGEQQQTLEVAQGEKVTFTNNLNTVELTVKKEWDDFDNKFNTRPETITFQLYSWPDGLSELLATPIGTPAKPQGIFEIMGPDFTPLKIAGLPATDKLGRQMHYKVKEINIQGNYNQTPAYQQQENDLIITNILPTTEITAIKNWSDQENKYDMRPESIQIQLYQNDEKMPGAEYLQTITPDENGDWSYSFGSLPKLDKEGEVYSYSIRELDVPVGYQAGYQEAVPGMELTNTLETVPFAGEKAWEDQANKFNTRPESIQVQLYQDNEKMKGEDYLKTVTPDEDGKWSYDFGNLPKFGVITNEETGKEEVIEHVYTVKEVAVPKEYESIVEEKNIMNRLITVSGNGEKSWEDQANKYNSRPENIQVQLYQDNEKMEGEDYLKTVTPDEDGNWSYDFGDLPKFDKDRELHEYEVKEVSAPKNYQATTNGLNVTNELLTTEINGRKIWDDQENQAGIRPDSVLIALMQDGQKIGEVTVTDEMNWRYTFEELPLYDPSGREYEYTVKEENVPTGYASQVNGYTITNTHVPETPNRSNLPNTSGGKKVSQSNSTSGQSSNSTRSLPKTNDTHNYEWVLAGLLLLIVVCGLVLKRRKTVSR
ncbi:Cna B-type domain-containing protein [Enterococcus devriesei]|uniref:Cna B-type domain-containing protein n=1 Tax=Enterococcus devriesei TaxID=319970 RepID=UPI0028B19121|nr:Cna B-type domain-containing protein [Enterococcus devriesei]